jgi:hypothetical protein
VGLKPCLRTAKQAIIISEKSHANDRRLKNLILVIAIAYTCAALQGQILKLGGIQKVRIQVFDWGIREGMKKSQQWADRASRKKAIALLP